MVLAHSWVVDVVIRHRGLYASRHRAKLISSHIIERKRGFEMYSEKRERKDLVCSQFYVLADELVGL